MTSLSGRPPYLSVGLLSACALAYEILLMRLFSIIQWHHFAYMVIGLALLGYGISGSVVSVFQRTLLLRFTPVYLFCAFLFAVTSVGCYLLAQLLPFNAEEVLWDTWQSLNLLAIFLLLTVPFIFAASAVCLALLRFDTMIARVYASDLFGAGLGSIAIIYLLFSVFPQTALIVIALLGLVAVLIALWELHVDRPWWPMMAVCTVAFALLMSISVIDLNISPYKGLQQSLRIAGTQVIEQRSSPLGLLTVIESHNIPLRHAPGLSLRASQGPPEQLGIFVDADNMSVISRMSDEPNTFSYLAQITSALPYQFKPLQQVLIVGAGGGADILQAQLYDVPSIEAVELNPQLIDLVSRRFADFSGHLYQRDSVSVQLGDARDFLRSTSQQYDLIQLALLDAFNASSAGLYAMHENYLYTLEAMDIYLQRLRRDGYLAITRWIRIPPRDTLKLFATAIDVLRRSGVEEAHKHLVLIRSWQTSTLLIKKSAFSQQELASVREFATRRSFDLVYLPDIIKDEVNQYNVLREAYFYQGATALLGDGAKRFKEQYKFNLQPATDDRPYFNHYFKWSAFTEIFKLRDKGGMALIEWGYLVPLLTFVIALLLSIVLILFPLRFLPRPSSSTAGIRRARMALYFFLLGLAFLFIEIAFIQKFVLFLHHPVYAIAACLAAFLVFAGLGSHISKGLSTRYDYHMTTKLAVSGICIISLLYLLSLDIIFAELASVPSQLRIVLAMLMISPLAFFMGMPFPMALSSLGQYDKHFVPWAWGINGCASVISAVLASLLALHYGFTVLTILALILYLLVLFLFPKQVQRVN